MNKTNVFTFMGEKELVLRWNMMFKKIKGKIYRERFDDEKDASFVGSLTAKQLSEFRSAFLSEDKHLQDFDTYPKDPSKTFVFIADQSVKCCCTDGYILYWGEWCACYECKGRGWRYPEEGRILLNKEPKPEPIIE